MGILGRFGDIMRSNVNAMLDKMEDPEKMIDQALLDARRDLAEAKKETASVMAAEKAARRQVDECMASITNHANAAVRALESGNEDDARKLIAKKQSLEENLVGLQKAYDLAKDNADKMRQVCDKLTADIQAMETRKAVAKSKMAAAKAQEAANRVSGVAARTRGSTEAFSRMEAKADRMLDEAQAASELASAKSEEEDLLAKYGSAGGSASVEEELAGMKAKLTGDGQ